MAIKRRWVPQTTRPVVMGSRHMVSTNHYLASTAALQILEQGGNAIDAGVAGGLCIDVVQPDIVNLGGVAPICLYSATDGRVRTISGLGTWPAKADPQYFVSNHGGRIPFGIHRSVIPSAVGAWLTALELFGTMSLAEVSASAIDLAANGFPIHSIMYESLSNPTALEVMRAWPTTASIFLDANGNPYPIGTNFVQADLARTLERLVEAEHGAASREEGIAAARDRFYRGDVAQEIVEFVQSQGGWMTAEDLSGFEVEIEDALTTNYHGYDVYACGPWCQGPVVLETLNILEGYDLTGLASDSTDRYHLTIESLKAAFADRDRYYGDPRFVDVPIDGLINKDYAAAWRERIDCGSASPGMPHPGDPWAFAAGTESEPSRWSYPESKDGAPEPDTSYLCVVDRHGNAFSATPSDGVTGSPIVEGLGLILSGRGGQSWVDERHPAAMRPGKRPRLTPNPGMVRKGDTLIMPYGTPGLDAQPQAMAQFLVNVIDYGMDVQAAIEYPRCISYSFPLSSDPHAYRPGAVAAENRVGEKVIDELRSRGHAIDVWPEFTGTAGSVCAVRAELDHGVFYGGADPRRLGYALGR